MQDDQFVDQFPRKARPYVREFLTRGWARRYRYATLDDARAAYQRLFDRVAAVRVDIGMVTALENSTTPILAVHSYEPMDAALQALLDDGIGPGELLPEDPHFTRLLNQRRLRQMLESMATGEMRPAPGNPDVMQVRREGMFRRVNGQGEDIPSN